MEETEIFESTVRPSGDLAGVYEYDGETGYFYLYQTGSNSNKVLGAIHIISGPSDFDARDVEIRWDKESEKVGLFIRRTLWAVFVASNRGKFGGDYKPGGFPTLSPNAAAGFVSM
jgi:hypothetical protein